VSEVARSPARAKRWTRLQYERLVDNTLEVYRDPEANPDSPYGWHYGSAVTLSAGDHVRPLSVPHGEIHVADLLP
jgi:hypothetical protein